MCTYTYISTHTYTYTHIYIYTYICALGSRATPPPPNGIRPAVPHNRNEPTQTRGREVSREPHQSRDRGTVCKEKSCMVTST